MVSSNGYSRFQVGLLYDTDVGRRTTDVPLNHLYKYATVLHYRRIQTLFSYSHEYYVSGTFLIIASDRSVYTNNNEKLLTTTAIYHEHHERVH